MLREKERRAHVECEHRLPLIDRHFTDRRSEHHRGGVDQRTERAVRREHAIDERLRRPTLAEIRVLRRSVAARLANESNGLLRAVARPVEMHDDLHAASAERERDGATDAPPRAGDERDSTGERGSGVRRLGHGQA
jgi:hypothetical protein